MAASLLRVMTVIRVQEHVKKSAAATTLMTGLDPVIQY
jgi:hypothetical protein